MFISTIAARGNFVETEASAANCVLILACLAKTIHYLSQNALQEMWVCEPIPTTFWPAIFRIQPRDLVDRPQ